MRASGKNGVIERILAQLRGLVEDVPPELEICEFHCTRPDCCRSDWEHCPLRKAWPVSLN